MCVWLVTDGELPPLFQCLCKNLARHWPDAHPTKLSGVCRHLKIELKHHAAIYDAHSCGQIVLAVGIKSTPTITKGPIRRRAVAQS